MVSNQARIILGLHIHPCQPANSAFLSASDHTYNQPDIHSFILMLPPRQQMAINQSIRRWCMLLLNKIALQFRTGLITLLSSCHYSHATQPNTTNLLLVSRHLCLPSVQPATTDRLLTLDLMFGLTFKKLFLFVVWWLNKKTIRTNSRMMVIMKTQTISWLM